MRNLLALIGLLVVGVGGIGWYMGWYKISLTRTSDGNLEIKTDVDTKKVNTDVTEGVKNISSAVENKANQAAKDAPPAGTPGATPGPVAPAQGSTFNPLAPASVVPASSPPQAPTLPTGGPIRLVPPK